jgi:hypothetical protein
MSFLGKIFGKAASGAEQGGDLPLRNRTFSATQFRDAELARAAESRARAQDAQIDAAQVLSPAVNPIAEALMAEENEAIGAIEPAEEFEPAPAPASAEQNDPVEQFEPAPAPAEDDEPVEQFEPSPAPADEDEPVEIFEPAPAFDAAVENEPIEEFEHAPAPAEEDEPAEELDPAAAPAAAEEFEPVEAFEPIEVSDRALAAASLPADPMPWDEAVGWLSQRSAETRNFVGTYWNWDYDLRVLHFLAQQPDLDAGVGAHIFWITAACEDYFPFGDDEPDSEISRQIEWLTDFLGRRFAEGAFRPASYGFDDSWDCTRLKRRLTELHDQGRLDWSPEAIPTSSTAELMSFDDIPEEEREEVGQFLARFGVY